MKNPLILLQQDVMIESVLTWQRIMKPSKSYHDDANILVEHSVALTDSRFPSNLRSRLRSRSIEMSRACSHDGWELEWFLSALFMHEKWKMPCCVRFVPGPESTVQSPFSSTQPLKFKQFAEENSWVLCSKRSQNASEVQLVTCRHRSGCWQEHYLVLLI